MLAGLLLCVLTLLSLGLSAHGETSSGPFGPVVAAETEAVPVAPEAPAPEMRRVWDAAVAGGDPWPGLTTRGRTGVPGNGVALTFDDGPDPVFTPRVLDTLREHGVKATFFVVGSSVAENPGLVRRIVAEGHVLGNHTYSHPDMASLGPAGMRRELRGTQKAVDEALGYHHPMALVRPPYGSPYFDDPGGALPVFRKVVKNENLFAVTWTVDPRDYLLEGRPENVARRVVRADGRGADVVLLHDTKAQTVEALPEIIAHYDASRSRLATVDELLVDKYTSNPR